MNEPAPVVEDEPAPVVEDEPAPVVEDEPADTFELSGDMEPGKPRKKSTPAAPRPLPPPEEDLGIVQPEFGF